MEAPQQASHPRTPDGSTVVAAGDETIQPRTGGELIVPAPWKTAASFVAAIRQGDTAALRALFTFYTPLLRDQARQMGVPAADGEHLVTTVLDDFVLHVLDADLVPREIARYLVGAVRNASRKRQRGLDRLRATGERAYTTLDAGDQKLVAECHSDYGVRTTRGPDLESAGCLHAAIAKLAEWSALALREDELALMIGVSRHIPLRELAAQAGVTYGAARVRVHRLRERFRKLVLQHVTSLEADERHEVERFLRRAGLCLETRAERAGGRDDTV
jgi:DNA-directed RNA polymerase specialized sigma24 family protein